MTVLFECRNLRRDVAERTILTNISFSLEAGQILFVRGPSGVGKSLLLRALACLDRAQAGTLLLHGSPPSHVGYPAWRTAVSYVPQSRASSLRGTPAELYFQVHRFASQRSRPRGDLPALVHALGLEQVVLNQQWAELSGGQAQRVALALSLALGPQVLLLDEPTSACDPISTIRVERVLATCGAALVWVTHDPHQPTRVGGRLLELPLATVVHLPPPPPQPPLPPLALLHREQEQPQSPSGPEGNTDADASGSSGGGGREAAAAAAAAAAALPGSIAAAADVAADGGGVGVSGGGSRGSVGGIAVGPGRLMGLAPGGLDSVGSSLPPSSLPASLVSPPPPLLRGPAGRPAELLDGDGDGDGELVYGYGTDMLSDSSPLSPPSPAQSQLLRGPRGVP